MILGILSDTHGHEAEAELGVALLRRVGATALVHCGDVGSAGVLEAMAGLPTWFVWGNTDLPMGPMGPMEAYTLGAGPRPPTDVPTRIELGGKRIAVFHGHEPAFGRLYDLMRAGDEARFEAAAACDYLLYGHTHVAADSHFGRVRMINPGALHRARPHTVATLDLAHDVVEHWLVAADEVGGGRFPQKYRIE